LSAEGGIGGRQGGADEDCEGPSEVTEEQRGDDRPEDHGQRKPDSQQSRGKIAGVSITATDYRDVVPVPAGASTVVRIAFSGLTGRTVYHCHILDHEDLGLMGVIDTA
jgi:FtsP/CotA-like multicopper oxidase with cupredoxin domain